MGLNMPRTDLQWIHTEEPHSSRQKIILEKYPQIEKLCGHDPKFKCAASALVFIQIAMLFVIKGQSWPVTLFVAYCFGGVINHSLLAAVHEIGHNLAFGFDRPMANRLFELFCNLPLGIPGIVSMQKRHLEHHRHHGVAGIPLEAKLFCTTFGKFLWTCLLPLFFIFRPLLVNLNSSHREEVALPFNRFEIINAAIQLTFDAIVIYLFGFNVLCYLIVGTYAAIGPHPVSGHFLSKYYMVAKGFEMYSYYGPQNLITFNVGYHSEHHDFLAVPGSRLPEVKRVATEFYDNLPHHNSLIRLMYDFITDPSIGPYAGIKRKQKNLDRNIKKG